MTIFVMKAHQIAWEAYHSMQETGTASGADGTYPIKDKRGIAELCRTLR